MRSLISALLLVLALSACDNELKLISRDFSVALNSIDGGTAAVGKAVNCTFTVSGLDADNGDRLLTVFDIEGGNGVIIVDGSEYTPGESFEYDYKANGKLAFDFVPTTAGAIFDIILVHDVIEHINPLQKKDFILKAKFLLKSNGIIFFGFPAWQMPFGGHQQICKNKIVSHLPFIHLLPKSLYRSVLRICNEDESCINELLNIKKDRVSIELFESLIEELELDIVDRCLWFINPHYKQKFNLKPRKMYPFIEKIPYVRNFFCTSCFYVIH